MKKKHLAVLRDIQAKIPKELLLGLVKKEKQFSTLKEVVEKALLEPDDVVTPEQKERYRNVLDSGYLEREIDVIDKTVEQQIDDLMTYEIKKAVDEGRLPKKAPALKLKNNKGKQYARRQAARLKSLINAERGTVTGDVEGVNSSETA